MSEMINGDALPWVTDALGSRRTFERFVKGKVITTYEGFDSPAVPNIEFDGWSISDGFRDKKGNHWSASKVWRVVETSPNQIDLTDRPWTTNLEAVRQEFEQFAKGNRIKPVSTDIPYGTRFDKWLYHTTFATKEDGPFDANDIWIVVEDNQKGEKTMTDQLDATIAAPQDPVDKEPAGVMLEYIWQQNRAIELMRAIISRFEHPRVKPERRWCQELRVLLEELANKSESVEQDI